MDEALENKMILNAYRGVLRSIKNPRNREESKTIRKAFNVAVKAHQNTRRKSGEPYIFHPLAVARICAEEIGLGPTSVVCAFLHDTVEDTPASMDELKLKFGNEIATLVDGVTKISKMKTQSDIKNQAENFRKLIYR